MPLNADDRLLQLETTVAELQQRLGKVERKVGVDTPAPTPVPLPAPTPHPDPITHNPGDPAPTPPTPSAPDTSLRDGWLAFEKWFGKYGMATAGALLLTIALSWGATLVYDHIGAEVKLAALGVTAAVLIFFGERKSRDAQITWWSQALIAVGYAVGQFMLYASHHVSSLQVLEDPLPSSIAMLALAGACGLHAIWRRSEPIALLSVLLAFVTLSLSPVSYFSVLASGLILTGLVLSAVRMRWYTVYVVGAAGCYATFLVFTQPQVMASAATAGAGLTLCAAFLAVYWLAFNVIGYLLSSGSGDSDKTKRGTIIGVTIANSAAFIAPTIFQMGEVFPEWRWAFLAGVGAAYLLSAPLYARHDKLIASVVLVLGLQFLTACVPLKLDAEAVAAVWLIEAAALSAIGMRAGMPVVRYFAAVLSVLCVGHLALFEFTSARGFELLGWAVPSRSLLGLVAAGVFTSCYALYQWAKFERRPGEEFFGQNYLRAALALTAVVALLDVPTYALPLVWGIQSVALVALGFLPPRRSFANAGFLFFAGAVLVCLIGSAQVGVPIACVLGALGVCSALAYRYGLAGDQNNQLEAQTRSEVYFIAAAVLSYGYTLCLHNTAQTFPVIQLCLQAVLLAVAGLALKSRVLRYIGAAGLALTAAGSFYMEMPWTWLNNGVLIGSLTTLALAYRFLTPADSRPGLVSTRLLNDVHEGAFAQQAYALASALLLAVTGAKLLTATGLTICWSLEGALLLALGFAFREKFVRSAGLILFIALIGKLLWFDLSGASDVVRVLSFLGASIVTLAGSWAYFRYTRDE